MRTVNSLATVLILFTAGISSLGIADGRTLNQNQKFLGILKNQCEKNGELTAYDSVVEKLSHLPNCGENQFDSFASEIADARLNGGLGSVFKRYCHQVPIFLTCIKNVTESFEPCMASEEREALHIISNMTSSIFDFMCHDDGDRITRFVANGGVDCSKAQQQSLESCINQTFARYMIDDDSDASSLTGGREFCSDLQKLQNCTVDVFENCDDPTPAKLVDSLYDYLLEAIPCNEFLDFEAPVSQPLEDLLVDIAKQKCDQNGGSMAYDSMHEELSELNDCVESVVRKDYIAHAKIISDLQKPSVEFLKMYCNHVPQVERCLNRFTDSARSCLESEERETADIVQNAVESVLKLLCSRGAEAYAEVIDSGGEECFISNERALQNCSQRFLGSYFTPERLTKPLVVNTEDCIIAKNTQTCMMEVLSECESQKTADFFKTLTDTAFESTPCKSLTTVHTVTEISNPSFAESGKSGEWKPYTSFEEKCEINGGPMAYEIAVESTNYVANSMKRLFTISHLRNPETEAARLLIKDTWCRRAPMIEKLAQFFTNSVRPCLEAKEMDFVDAIDNMTSRGLEFFCENEGESFSALLHPDGIKCFGDKTKNLLRCFGEARLERVDMSEEVPILSIYNKPLIFSTEDCTDLEQLRDCAIDVLAECEQQTFSQLVNSLLDIAVDAADCKNLVQTETSSPKESISSSTEQEEEEFGIDVLLSLLPDKSDWNGIVRRSRNKFREMCFENGGVAAYKAARGLPKYIQDGVTNLRMSLHRLDSDIEDARWRGREELDAVFFKYCDDFPAVKEYLKHIVDSLKPCLDQRARENVDIVYDTIESSLYFMCANDGERLAGFVGTGGVKCVAENFEPVSDCIAKSLNPVTSSDGSFVLGVKECHAIETAQHCVVTVIEKCESQTPATTINELFNLLFIESPCDDILKDEMLNSNYFRTLGQVVSRVVGS